MYSKGGVARGGWSGTRRGRDRGGSGGCSFFLGGMEYVLDIVNGRGGLSGMVGGFMSNLGRCD